MTKLLKKVWKQKKKKVPIGILSFNEQKQKQTILKAERKKAKSKLDELRQKKKAYYAEQRRLKMAKESKEDNN